MYVIPLRLPRPGQNFSNLYSCHVTWNLHVQLMYCKYVKESKWNSESSEMNNRDGWIISLSSIEMFTYILVCILFSISSINSECCESIAITSSSVGKSYQEHQLGIYSIKPGLKVNDRPVYKQNKGDQYLYYWVGIKIDYTAF